MKATEILEIFISIILIGFISLICYSTHLLVFQICGIILDALLLCLIICTIVSNIQEHILTSLSKQNKDMESYMLEQNAVIAKGQNNILKKLEEISDR